MPKKAVVEVLEIPESGKWVLKEKGDDTARASFDQKEDALAAGDNLAKNIGGTVKVGKKLASEAGAPVKDLHSEAKPRAPKAKSEHGKATAAKSKKSGTKKATAKER